MLVIGIIVYIITSYIALYYTFIDHGDVANWYEKNKTLFEKKINPLLF